MSPQQWRRGPFPLTAMPWGIPQLNAHHAFGADNCISASGHEHGWCQPAFVRASSFAFLCLSSPALTGA